jgi:hypothetical protein
MGARKDPGTGYAEATPGSGIPKPAVEIWLPQGPLMFAAGAR